MSKKTSKRKTSDVPETKSQAVRQESSDSKGVTDATKTWSYADYDPGVIPKYGWMVLIASLLLTGWLGFLLYVVVNL